VYDTARRRPVPLPVSGSTAGSKPVFKLYVCGITPYDSGHIGHAFTYCAFDVLVRWVEARGVGVRYVQNVTDVDDPLFTRARRDGVPWRDLARREAARFTRDMARLGWRAPDVMPRASEEIPGILRAIRRLDRRGYCYRTDAVYFDVGRFRRFGGLSRLSFPVMMRALRQKSLAVSVGPDSSREPLDFQLWRRSEPDEPAWPSPYGPGRPGWHIQCSSIVIDQLGPQVDVHGGGRDLVFPHHESERAQSEALTGKAPFARAWMHTGMVRYQGAKMSKSLGNLVLIDQALRQASPGGLRLYLASHHYRRDWSFDWEGLKAATRLADAVARVIGPERRGHVDETDGRGGGERGPRAEFAEAMDDDLDTPRALRVLRKALDRGDAAGLRWMTGILCGRASLRRTIVD
jgi:L-cysteine:1D-myo-inositol 2-amino-2-deoxy-alpha-D-glucopyranoside ligase